MLLYDRFNSKNRSESLDSFSLGRFALYFLLLSKLTSNNRVNNRSLLVCLRLEHLQLLHPGLVLLILSGGLSDNLDILIQILALGLKASRPCLHLLIIHQSDLLKGGGDRGLRVLRVVSRLQVPRVKLVLLQLNFMG